MFDDLRLRVDPSGKPIGVKFEDGETWPYCYEGLSNPDGFVNKYSDTSQARTLSWLHAYAIDPDSVDALWAAVWMGDRGRLVNPAPVAGHQPWEFRFDHGGWDAMPVSFNAVGCARVSVVTKVLAVVQFERKLLPV